MSGAHSGVEPSQRACHLWSECGTCSHAVISSLGARARGGVVGRRRSVSHVVRPGLEQTSGMSHRDGFRQPHSNFSNRPYPLAQNRGTILMGIVLWRVTENPQNRDFGFGQNRTFQKKVMISTSGPAAEIPDGTDGCAVKS